MTKHIMPVRVKQEIRTEETSALASNLLCPVCNTPMTAATSKGIKVRICHKHNLVLPEVSE